ncbi:unnamed protein product [Haemonchus placei]|uniref:Secreted protein n=1 Tax=Haemonchus placei TaxID=6290 RepID=A0A0N4WSS5_HAEPC|nr:unnamed protein product [Haemonchus placei]
MAFFAVQQIVRELFFFSFDLLDEVCDPAGVGHTLTIASERDVTDDVLIVQTECCMMVFSPAALTSGTLVVTSTIFIDMWSPAPKTLSATRMDVNSIGKVRKVATLCGIVVLFAEEAT